MPSLGEEAVSKSSAARLERWDACPEAVKWVRGQKGTAQAIWARCRRADWMLWIAARVAKHGSPEHRAVVLAACA